MSATLELQHGRIELLQGNIVEQTTDAIVNAANTKLAGGGGVDGAIHRAAGPTLLAACLELPANEDGRRCPTGECRTTHAGDLAAKFVIHAVGPFYNAKSAKSSEEKLASAYRNSLQAAADHGCQSVAFPAISCGAYRFPVFTAAKISIGVVADWLDSRPSIELVRFVLFDASTLEKFARALEEQQTSR